MRPLTVVAIDDPELPTTWSGTPKSIIDSLRAAGRTTYSLSADVPRSYDKVLYGSLGVPLFGKGARGFRQYYGPRKGRLERRVSDHRLVNPETAYLHTDHMWTPFIGMGKKDFFFRDTSWSAYSEHQGIGHRLQKHIAGSVKNSLMCVGHIFATSEWAKHELILEGARSDSVTVVGTGVGNLVQPYYGKSDYTNKRTLCIAKARLHNKGLDLLLDGFRLARAIDHELELDVVVPPGVIEPQPGVNLHSNLTAQQLIDLYRSASLYAMPARYEPWGLVYLEAQLSALPILGSSLCAFPELSNNGETGYIVPSLTPQGVSTCLLEAHGSPDQLRLKGQRGLKYSEEFTWERTVHTMLSIIDTVS